MGTRSVTYIHNGDLKSDILCAIYRQFDGYPTGMGNDIVKILGHKKLVNGLNSDTTNVCNGLGCAAATLVKNLKEDAGSIYMCFTTSLGEEWNYHIFFDGDRFNPGADAKLSMTCSGYGDDVWSGFICDFDGEKIESENSE